jgi:hypothetical protein
MGSRAWDAYSAEAREHGRVSPRRERYRLASVIIFALIIAFAALIVVNVVHAQPAKLTNEQIVETIIQLSRHTYDATGHSCGCPYDHDQFGHSCNGRSSYSRSGGAEPKCYPKDVSTGEIETYRASHR